MIDSRKRKYEYPKTVKQFINEAEKEGFEVEYLKQYNSKSIFTLRKDGFEENGEFQHVVTDGRKYFHKIWKPMIWDMKLKIEEMRKEK
jgi:Fe-S oxidoreductase